MRDPLDFLRLHVEHLRVREQVAVEVENLVRAEKSAFGHRLEELRYDLAEARRVILGILEDAAEEALGQQPHVLGEEAEDDPVEEVGHFKRRQATAAHGLARSPPAAGRPQW